jgi:hypothetical protein
MHEMKGIKQGDRAVDLGPFCTPDETIGQAGNWAISRKAGKAISATRSTQ